MGTGELESNHGRPVGSFHCRWVSDSFPYSTSPNQGASSLPIFGGGEGCSGRAIGRAPTEGGDQPSGGPGTFYQYPFPPPQDRRPVASYLQLAPPQRICGNQPFQDGDDPAAGRHPHTALLDVQGGPIRRLPLDPHLGAAPAVSAVPVERGIVGIQLSAFRLGGRSAGLYQSSHSGRDVSQGPRTALACLSGRLADRGFDSLGHPARHGDSGCFAGNARLQGESHKINHAANTGHPLSGHVGGQPVHDAQPPQGQAGQAETRMPPPSQSGMGDRTRDTDRPGENGSSDSSHQSCTVTRPGFAILTPGQRLRRDAPQRLGEPRSPVVERSVTFPELQPHYSPGSQPRDFNRCLQLGLGRCERDDPHNGRLASGGAQSSHQLEGAFCCVHGPDGLCPSAHGDLHSFGERQSHGSRVYQPPGRHPITTTVPVGTGHLGLRNLSEATPDCSPCSRSRQPGGRPPVPGAPSVDHGMGTATLPVLCDSGSAPREPHTGSVRSPAQCAPSSVCELEARPSGQRNRCVQHSVSFVGECICVSPVQFSGPLPAASSPGENPPLGVDRSPVATSTVVLTASTTGVSASPAGAVSSTTRSVREPASAAAPSSIGRLDYLRDALEDRGLSAGARNLWLAAWRSSTSSTYESAWRQFSRWCGERQIDCLSATPTAVSNFLSDAFDQGRAYRTLNVYRSAISTALPPSGGQPLGQHRDVCQVMRGAFHRRPPQPRYSASWDVSEVLSNVQTWGSNDDLSLNHLSWKLVLLLALTRAPRVGELQALDCRHMQRLPDGVLFRLSTLTKTQRSGGPHTFFFPSFPSDARLCPVRCLTSYLARTASFRPSAQESHADPLFLAIPAPHHPVSTDTLSRWLKSALGKCGVDTATFKAHSTRGASTTAAREQGVTMEVILATADWSRPHTFVAHYYRPHALVAFGRSVLGQGSNPSDTPPSLSGNQ